MFERCFPQPSSTERTHRPLTRVPSATGNAGFASVSLACFVHAKQDSQRSLVYACWRACGWGCARARAVGLSVTPRPVSLIIHCCDAAASVMWKTLASQLRFDLTSLWPAVQTCCWPGSCRNLEFYKIMGKDIPPVFHFPFISGNSRVLFYDLSHLQHNSKA